MAQPGRTRGDCRKFDPGKNFVRDRGRLDIVNQVHSMRYGECLPQINEDEYVTRPWGQVNPPLASGVQTPSIRVIMNTVTPHCTMAPIKVANPWAKNKVRGAM